MDTWFSASKLGSHRHPARPPGRQLVLLVRGELLKKYPNTIVYAQKAHIFRRKDGTADSSQDPIIQEVKAEAEMHAEIRFPLFRAEIEPDIRFFGFDMTPEEAKGAEHPQNATDDWGWYFIIQEVPGEPRFGMDIEFDPDSPTVVTWYKSITSWAMNSTKSEEGPFIAALFGPAGTTGVGTGRGGGARWAADPAVSQPVGVLPR